MLFIYSSKGGQYQPYSKIPKAIMQQYGDLNLLVSILGSMAANNRSRYYFSNWESALKAAWKVSIRNGLNNHFGRQEHYGYSNVYDYPQGRDRVLSTFLQTQTGHYLWASNPRTEPNLSVARSNALNNRFFKKAEKANVSAHYNQQGEIQQRKETLKMVYSALMTYLSPRSNPDDRFRALMQLHSHNSVMNCEQFVAYALGTVGIINESDLQTVFSACAVKDNLGLLHDLLGFESRKAISSSDEWAALTESQILFESQAPDAKEVTHMLIYNHVDQHIYDLAFGDTEAEWRLKKMPIKVYLADMAERKKVVAAAPISSLKVESVLANANTVLDSTPSADRDESLKKYGF
ncbi:hypothetical protein Lrub_1550 [Legionella rubrilucens]|uniref:Uncharacterized protein n=1 Tax=Legionella rubrilucens TaxID=458 RepID=A0A0W0XQ32_9GAMM|nr:hypothetical protein [Legionella rubrilucens]KTD46628.1 hypothetical protein Lrub_1550 [Legionella rubrilucens]